jgi:hypothetical protein
LSFPPPPFLDTLSGSRVVLFTVNEEPGTGADFPERLRSFFLNATINQYVFVGNNPVNRRDPYGLRELLNLYNPKLSTTDWQLHYGAAGAAPGNFTSYSEDLFRVAGHGACYPDEPIPWAAFFKDRESNDLTAVDLAKKMKAAGWLPGQDVYLEGCNVGTGPDGDTEKTFAKELADALTTLYGKTTRVYGAVGGSGYNSTYMGLHNAVMAPFKGEKRSGGEASFRKYWWLY